MEARIQLGSRVYLRNAIAGEPGILVGFRPDGKAIIDWPDLWLGRYTTHSLDSLTVDESFIVRQLDLFESSEVAA